MPQMRLLSFIKYILKQIDMVKYKIVKRSNALPEMWEVGRELETEVQSNLCWYERPNKAITQEHVNALIELGVVEEVKDTKRGCCFNCDIRDRAEEYGYPVGGCMKQPAKKEWNPRELKPGNMFYKIAATSWVICTTWSGDACDRFDRALGNCHPTKEAAKAWRDKLLADYK